MSTTDKINQIAETLCTRSENPEYLITYLKNIIRDLGAVAPNQVHGYLDVVIYNMERVKNHDALKD